MAEAGSREKDVYFPTVPSQKSTPSVLATITEQLLWLGGPGLGSARLTLLPPASLRTPPRLPGVHTPACKNRRKAHEKQSRSTCLHPAKTVQNYGVFIAAGGSGGRGGGISKFTCGRMPEVNLSSK